MPRTPEKNAEVREARRTQILSAALSAYLQYGYHGCDMDIVAEEAGLAKGLLYYYYKTKNALFAGLFTEMFDKASRLSDALIEQIGGLEPVEQLMRYVYGMFEENCSDPRLMRFLLRAPFDAIAVFGPEKWANGARQSKAHSAAMTKMIELGIERGVIPAVNATNAANSFWSVYVANLFSYSKLMVGEKPGDRERGDFREVVRFCFQGLGIEHDVWVSCLEKVVGQSNTNPNLKH